MLLGSKREELARHPTLQEEALVQVVRQAVVQLVLEAVVQEAEEVLVRPIAHEALAFSSCVRVY